MMRSTNAFHAPTRFDLDLFEAAIERLGGLKEVAIQNFTELSQGYHLGYPFEHLAQVTIPVIRTQAKPKGAAPAPPITLLVEVPFGSERLAPGHPVDSATGGGLAVAVRTGGSRRNQVPQGPGGALPKSLLTPSGCARAQAG